mmetsp:Transcript_3754/g.11907  ORF Transcript_3754/g.11907 Transcript_3754/m.11907 type:complete len:244 (+) Transcript_3754:453-1184(+)
MWRPSRRMLLNLRPWTRRRRQRWMWAAANRARAAGLAAAAVAGLVPPRRPLAPTVKAAAMEAAEPAAVAPAAGLVVAEPGAAGLVALPVAGLEAEPAAVPRPRPAAVRKAARGPMQLPLTSSAMQAAAEPPAAPTTPRAGAFPAGLAAELLAGAEAEAAAGAAVEAGAPLEAQAMRTTSRRAAREIAATRRVVGAATAAARLRPAPLETGLTRHSWHTWGTSRATMVQPFLADSLLCRGATAS